MASKTYTAQKMREALSDACYAMFNFLKTQNGGYEEMAKALDKAKSALAEPQRNCDRFETFEQANETYHEECCYWFGGYDGVGGTYIRKNGAPSFERWLFKKANKSRNKKTKTITNKRKQCKSPKTCDRCKTWKRDGKTCVGTCPHQDGMTAEWMSGCPFFS